MNQNLGNLEETVLLIVAVKQAEAYGYTVSETYHEHMGSRISISAIHTVLKRLEKKGLIASKMGGATAERGGRRKRIFEVTKIGLSTLENRISGAQPPLLEEVEKYFQKTVTNLELVAALFSS